MAWLSFLSVWFGALHLPRGAGARLSGAQSECEWAPAANRKSDAVAAGSLGGTAGGNGGGGGGNGTTVSFTPTSTFGLFFTVAATNSSFATQNALDNGNGAGTSESRFAMFRIPDQSSVPEPGTMALFGIGALTLGLPWLRKLR